MGEKEWVSFIQFKHYPIEPPFWYFYYKIPEIYRHAVHLVLGAWNRWNRLSSHLTHIYAH